MTYCCPANGLFFNKHGDGDDSEEMRGLSNQALSEQGFSGMPSSIPGLVTCREYRISFKCAVVSKQCNVVFFFHFLSDKKAETSTKNVTPTR